MLNNVKQHSSAREENYLNFKGYPETIFFIYLF